MNANVLHRWLKEHQRSGPHQLAAHSPAAALEMTSPLAAFIPLQLPAAAPQPEAREIKVELHKGALSMVVTWPVSAAAECACLPYIHWYNEKRIKISLGSLSPLEYRASLGLTA